MIVKHYLNLIGTNVPNFTNNLPGDEWAYSFLQRHKDKLTNRKCQNITYTRASVNKETLQEYFNNLQIELEGIEPTHIFNYDETNLTDDPRESKVITKRGVKYPERIMNSSKSAISLMFCGSATGTFLPPYVVYKSEHLWSKWMEGGPDRIRYNR